MKPKDDLGDLVERIRAAGGVSIGYAYQIEKIREGKVLVDRVILSRLITAYREILEKHAPTDIAVVSNMALDVFEERCLPKETNG